MRKRSLLLLLLPNASELSDVSTARKSLAPVAEKKPVTTAAAAVGDDDAVDWWFSRVVLALLIERWL